MGLKHVNYSIINVFACMPLILVIVLSSSKPPPSLDVHELPATDSRASSLNSAVCSVASFQLSAGDVHAVGLGNVSNLVVVQAGGNLLGDLRVGMKWLGESFNRHCFDPVGLNSC